ncbi:methyltransferase domain-containing protein [Cellulomonas sp. JZ18]|uniref:methyltransferase domain-containing protein n=1 Tax=Cellulomonas sp. JZ18 TaxID=2654191 RepID=UPI0012D400CF|nr:methyltransferase domain-containing protein [Cellulomonas sp. JZ18]QGQ19643.1 methyltransferase domain-containing protein [Cellulomonas sp. JZ18]
MIVSSRSEQEYRAFFALGDDDLAGRVLDCSAGASGFTAAVGAAGGDVTAVDPVYADPQALRDTVERSAAAGAALVDAHDDRFTWSWYGSPQRHRALRDAALATFLEDLAARPERYVVGSLPDLPFPDGAFDLALCSHLLFTWADVLDAPWHHAALTELLRVAHEVRVFPLVQRGAGEPVGFLPALLDTLRDEGRCVQVVPVPYEFQVGADRMLVVRR